MAMNDYYVIPTPGVTQMWPSTVPNPTGTWPLTMRDSSNLWVVPQCIEKPHETINRALKEIAVATRELRESAQALGLGIDTEKLLSALAARLRDEMKD